jgi:Holliday junction DNA helicase RuvA
MFESMKGILKEKEPLKAILEVGGIGYRITIPLNTYTKLPTLEEIVLLHLSQVIREDSHTLYGFIDKQERDLFEMLITLSGIGPKTAVGIIGHMELASFHNAIATADTRILSKIPGIGKKTAERLVLEMRDKLKNIPKKQASAPLSLSGGDTLLSDAVNALMNLGYHPVDAQKAVQTAKSSADEEIDLGTLITLALKKV